MSAPEPASEGLRLDKWLWQARFFKTRALAAQLVGKRRVRINQAIVTKAHHRIRPGDVLTFPQGAVVRVVRVVDLGSRRGPAREAQSLYEEIVGNACPAAPVCRRRRRSSGHSRQARTSGGRVGFRRPFAEDRAADPHVSRAELHSDLVVGAHAHAQLR